MKKLLLCIIFCNFVPFLPAQEKIIAQNKQHLQTLIQKEIEQNGDGVNLNFIDTSLIKDMSYLFYNSTFNGNISEWDVSNVIIMSYLFYNAAFNGNISEPEL